MNHFTEEINLPEQIFRSLKQVIESHFTRKNMHVDGGPFASAIGGILISQLVWKSGTPYHRLPQVEKEALLERYSRMLGPLVGNIE